MIVLRTLACGSAALALAGCETAAPPRFEAPQRFSAIGTEPFWAANVDGARLTYSTPEDSNGKTFPVSRTANATSEELAGLLDGQRFTLIVTAGPCSDGMSDTAYPFSVVRRIGDDTQRGCARPR